MLRRAVWLFCFCLCLLWTSCNAIGRRSEEEFRSLQREADVVFEVCVHAACSVWPRSAVSQMHVEQVYNHREASADGGAPEPHELLRMRSIAAGRVLRVHKAHDNAPIALADGKAVYVHFWRYYHVPAGFRASDRGQSMPARDGDQLLVFATLDADTQRLDALSPRGLEVLRVEAPPPAELTATEL